MILAGKKKQKGTGVPARNLSTHVDLPSDLDITDTMEIPVVNPETKEEVLIGMCFCVLWINLTTQASLVQT